MDFLHPARRDKGGGGGGRRKTRQTRARAKPLFSSEEEEDESEVESEPEVLRTQGMWSFEVALDISKLYRTPLVGSLFQNTLRNDYCHFHNHLVFSHSY